MSLHEDVNNLGTHQKVSGEIWAHEQTKIWDKITEENALFVSGNVSLNILAPFKFKGDSYFTVFPEEVNYGLKRNGNNIISFKQGFRNWRSYVILLYYVDFMSWS
jgi:hypothetical protein